jgi:hypothetical protein
MSGFLSRSWPWLIGLAVGVGALLRLSFPNDIEYKGDEQFSFKKIEAVGKTEPWPRVGDRSGAGGAPHVATSLWIFVGLGKLFSIGTPPGLARAVQVINVGALVGMALFAAGLADSSERKTWLWGTALAAVNPLGVLLQRKIWIQSILPPFCLVALAGWWRRDRRVGAFAWGAGGALLGQIHLSGFFFAAALLGWTVLFQHRIEGSSVTNRTTRWGFWFAGSACAGVLMLPWIRHVLSSPNPATPGTSLGNIVDSMLSGYGYWLEGDPVGMGLRYSISNWGVSALWRYPYVLGRPTHGIGLVTFALAALGFWLILKAVMDVWENGAWKNALIGTASPTAFLIGMTLFAYIPLISLPGVMHRHYMVVTYPVPWLWVAWLALRHQARPDRILAFIFVGQAVISAAFLYFIHVNGGMPGADYGVSYSAQAAR